MLSSNDLPRQSNNQIRLGTVAELDLGKARCRVESGDLLTDFLPWLVPRAGEVIEWSAPSVGEQVLLLSPGGDLHGAVVLRGLYSDAFPSPDSTEARHLIRFPDGALVDYDHTTHALSATLPGGGALTVTADGGITLNGPLTVNGDTQHNGDVSISGQAEAQVDVIGAGKSLKSHQHSAVQSGSGTSGPPQ